MTDWIDRCAAVAKLGVKPQTLYAYASRGIIRVMADPDDSRCSLYNAADIAALTDRRKRGRKPAAIAASSMSWGEPSLETALSTIHRGQLLYRGQDAIALAHSATLEDVASLLWDCPGEVAFSAPTGSRSGDAFAALSAMIPTAMPTLGRGRRAVVRDAAAIVGTLANMCGAVPGDDPLHLRLVRGWGGGRDAAEKIRQALVVMADHEFNASTFAARVAASTGAALAASVLAGLCTLSGPLHGGAAAALSDLIADAERSGIETAIGRWLARGGPPPGFGHPLYPTGDPRAKLLLDGLSISPFLDDFRIAMERHAGLLPTCDFALAAVATTFNLPSDAAFRLFLLGRSVGWCAHAMEQCENGSLIRPRGRYVGELGD